MRTRGRPLRWVLSHTPALGLRPSPLVRPAGISAFVRVKNEADWIEPCLRSVQEAVDEIVVVDNGSTDRTPEILGALKSQLAPKLRLFSRPDLDHVALSNFALDQTRYRWVLKWDGDFVAHTRGPRAIQQLRERILALPQDRYHHIHLTCVELMGDLWHQLPTRPLRDDPFIATFSPAFRFVRVTRRIPQPRLLDLLTVLRTDPRAVYTFHFEDVQVPLHYRVLTWDARYHVHLQIENAMKMYVRDSWADWMENPALQRQHRRLEEYALKRAQAAWKVATLEEAAREFMQRVCQRLIPYDADRWGELPELLRPYQPHPSYRVLYKDGRPWSRSDLVGQLTPTSGEAG